MKRRLLAGGIGCVLLCSFNAKAQTPSSVAAVPANPNYISGKGRSPIPAAHKPVFVPIGMDLKASVGYTDTSLEVPSASRLNLMGIDAEVIADLSPFFGVTADSSYVKTANVFSTSHDSNVLSYLGGPVLYPVTRGKIRAYVHGLVGGAKVDGVIPESSGGYQLGYVNKLSWAVGGGVEYQVSPSFAFRSGGDYQHTYFYNADLAVRGQNGFRVVCSVVFSVWQYPKRRY
jgi:opacity protein-like surface antigen